MLQKNPSLQSGCLQGRDPSSTRSGSQADTLVRGLIVHNGEGSVPFVSRGIWGWAAQGRSSSCQHPCGPSQAPKHQSLWTSQVGSWSLSKDQVGLPLCPRSLTILCPLLLQPQVWMEEYCRWVASLLQAGRGSEDSFPQKEYRQDWWVSQTSVLAKAGLLQPKSLNSGKSNSPV